MKNTDCNSFYANDEPIANSSAVTNLTDPTTVLLNNSTGKKTLDTAPEITPVVKKKSTLWIWAASYLAAVLISPSENLSYIDKTNPNVTP